MRRLKAPELETRFSELLGVLSTRFARISHNEIETEVSGWLERICHSLGFDRSVLAEYLPEKHDFFTTYRWNREGFPQAPGPIAPASDYLPWVSAKGASGDIVVVPNVATLPKEAAHDRNFMLQYGMKSILGVPLIIGNRLIAGIAFEDFQAERQLTPTLLGRLKLVSEIFANALERKRAAIEAAKIREDAENISRLALMGEMAAAIAHELSHPLGAILANAQAARRLLDRRQPRLSELRETLDDVITAERRAATYVAKVRSIFRRSELHKKPLDVQRILEDIASLTRADLQARSVYLELYIEPRLPLILADRVGIEQVMINLIQNAADASLDGARSDRRVTVRAFQKDSRWVGISVNDAGKGIDPEDCSRIFQPLFTTKPKGTGLGLTIVRSIVESHGAEIQVHSEPGNGATFEFALPVAGTL